jgi:hypothetical protein
LQSLARPEALHQKITALHQKLHQKPEYPC